MVRLEKNNPQGKYFHARQVYYTKSRFDYQVQKNINRSRRRFIGLSSVKSDEI